MRFLNIPILPIWIKVKSQSMTNIIKLKLDCPLCEDSNEYQFPKERKNYFGWHYKLGLTWKPEKGHHQYELHRKLNYHYL